MKTIIAGSRGIKNRELVFEIISTAKWEITEIVSGGANGVDSLGEDYAKEKNIPLKIFPANWARYGKQAGYKRNAEMVGYADALIAIWDGRSPGTLWTIRLAADRFMPMLIVTIPENLIRNHDCDTDQQGD